MEQQQIKKAYKRKNEKIYSVLHKPYTYSLGWGSGHFIILFYSLKQLIDWYSSKNKSKDVKILLMAKKGKNAIWEGKFHKIFMPDVDELRNSYFKTDFKHKGLNTKFFGIFPNFEDFLEECKNGINGLNEKKRQAMEVISYKDTVFFAICEIL